MERLMHKPMELLLLFASYLRTELLSFLALITGWLFGLALLLQTNDSSAWYPIIISTVGPAVVTSLFLFASEYLKRKAERQKTLDEQKTKEGGQNLSYGEKLVEMSLAERAHLLDEREKDHQTEIKFYKYQLEIKKVEAIEARFRAHFYTNQASNASLHIQHLHVLMSEAKLEIPKFQLATEEEMQIALQAELAAYRQKLEKEKELMIHLTNE